MDIVISKQAVDWFKEDVGVKPGDLVRFYVQIYGNSPVQQGFSLAFTKEDPVHMGASTEIEGMIFYIEESDLWYFSGHDLHVDYREKEDELEYTYVKQ